MPTERPMPKLFVAIGLAIIPPYAFVATLLREGRSAWWLAWNSAMQEIEAGKRAWRGESARNVTLKAK